MSEETAAQENARLRAFIEERNKSFIAAGDEIVALRAEVLRLQRENIDLDGKWRYWKREANEALARLELFRRAAVAAGMIESPGWDGSEEDETR